MKRVVIGLLLVTATAASAIEASPAGDVTMRKLWATLKVDKVDAVQQVFSRVVTFKLPRPFVMVNRGQAQGSFLAEYVPDGQTVDNWTRMITVTGTLGIGAAGVSDTELAAHFEPKDCPGKVFRDLGPTAPLAGVTGRMVVIGCGAPDQPGAERGAIAVYRDSENGWTIQYAERNHGKSPFTPDEAVARLAALAPAVIPRAPAALGAPK